jgi:autotransporter-associated beta strand protein
MKTRVTNLLLAVVLVAGTNQLFAVDYYKANNINNLNAISSSSATSGTWTSWVKQDGSLVTVGTNAFISDATGVYIWDNRVTGTNGSVQSGNVTFGQIKILDTSVPIDIRNGTITLNGVMVGGTNIGIDMSNASSDLTFYGVVVANTAQTWVLGNGKTLSFVSYNGNTDDALNNVNNVTITGTGNFVYGPRNGNSKISIANNWDFTGSLTAFGGGLSLASSGSLKNLTELVVGGQITIDAGAANRINTAAKLTLGDESNGGGTFTVNANQAFSQSQVVNGYNSVAGTGTVTISDGYKRSTVGLLKVNDGSKFVFTNAPSAANGDAVIGSGENAILLGAVVGANSDNFIKAISGTLTAATYSNNTWGTGLNTNLTAATTITTNAVAQSLRFDSNSPNLTISTGTLTLESGMMLFATGANINGPGSLMAGSGRSLMWIGESGRNSTISANILDNGNAVALEKYGGGALGLSGSNTFTGEIYLHGGALIVNNQYALGVGNANLNVVSGNSTLTLGADNLDIQRNIFIQRTEGTFTVNLNNGVVSSTISGDFNAAGNNRQTFVKSGTGTLYLTGKLTDAVSTFQINNTGTVVLTGTVDNSSLNYALGFDIRSANTGTAVFTMKGDAVMLRPGGNIYSNSDGSTLIMNIQDRAYLYSSSAFSIGNNANPNSNRKVILNIADSGSMVTNSSVNINNAASAVTDVNLSGNALFQVNGDLNANGLNNANSSSNAVLTINVAGNATLNVNNGGSRLFLGKGNDALTTLNQNGGLVKAAQLVFNGDNYANNVGVYNFNSGTMELGSNNNSVIVLSQSGTLNLNGGSIRVLSTSSKIDGQANTGTGSLIVQAGGGTIDVTQNTTFTSVVAFQHDSNLINTKDGGLTKTGIGTLSMNALNTYTGDTVIRNGILKAGIASVAGVGGAFGNNSVLGFDTGGETAALDLNGFNTQIGGLYGGDNYTGFVTGTAGAPVLTINSTGSTSFGGGITGAGLSIVKTGTGTQTLTGDLNSYGGSTTVNQGTLLIAGAGNLSNTSGVSVNGGGIFDYAANTALNRNVTLSGGVFKYNSGAAYSGNLTFTSGTIGGSGNFAKALSIGTNQVIAPGNSVGNFQTGAQTWLTGGAYQWEISSLSGVAGTSWDLISITGSLNLSGINVGGFTMLLNALSSLSDFDPSQSYTWKVATASGGITGFNASEFTINSSNMNGLDPSLFTMNVVGNDLNLVYLGVIPEPSTWALMIVGAGILVVSVARRRKYSAKM